jgi:bcr-type benzoyl-CoA reductase subunit C
MPIIEEFKNPIPLMNSWVNNWKDEGKKVLGYFCTYIPEEIFHSAGILPIRMRARDCTDTPMGDAYMTPTTCSYTRCCLELANRKQYNFLDGIVSCNSCDQVRRLYDNIRYKAPFPYHYIMGVPGNVSDTTIDWFKHEITKLIQHIEKNFDVSITNEKLSNSIKIYNKSRSLLKELYMLRKQENPPITGTNVMNIVTAGTSMPREQFNKLLESQLSQIAEEKDRGQYKSRLMIVGSMLDEPEYIEIIENLGGLVVTDSLCLGTRYFWDLVDEKLNPIDGLANRYLSKISCPRMTDGHKKREDFMMDMIKDFKVDGVILQRMKFCALWWPEVFLLRNKLKEAGIPSLELEREYILSGAGAIKTRIQTFMEILESR